MNPQYPEQNPYDFIMNPNQPPPKRMLDVNSKNGFILKISLIVGGVVLLMIAVAIGLNMLTGSKTNTEDLKLLAQTQQELIRITGSAEGGNGIRDQPLKNSNTSIRLTITTQQATLLKYLEAHGAGMKDKQLGLKANTKTDSQLSQAQATSTYDIVFRQVIQKSLTSYAQEVQTSYNNAPAKDVRDYLKKSYDQTQLLLQQLPTDGTTTTADL